jgi:hypothetical protein
MLLRKLLLVAPVLAAAMWAGGCQRKKAESPQAQAIRRTFDESAPPPKPVRLSWDDTTTSLKPEIQGQQAGGQTLKDEVQQVGGQTVEGEARQETTRQTVAQSEAERQQTLLPLETGKLATAESAPAPNSPTTAARLEAAARLQAALREQAEAERLRREYLLRMSGTGTRL